MPATLPGVLEIVDLLDRLDLRPVTLLVVPGAGWRAAELDRLRELAAAGYPLAGHGWRHRADAVRGWRHRLHSAVLSRDVAEHLALDADGIAQRIERCHAWFADHGFAPPTLYVPPAWAMGRIGRAKLVRLPFRSYEVLTGVLEARAGRFVRLPLAGFEADTAVRVAFLRLSNRLNRALAGPSRPLRVGMHPRDLQLPLATSLGALLRAADGCLGYDEIP